MEKSILHTPISITVRSLHLSKKSVKSRKESSSSFTVLVKLNFGLPQLILPPSAKAEYLPLLWPTCPDWGPTTPGKGGDPHYFWPDPQFFMAES